jgi:hypothetical protein
VEEADEMEKARSDPVTGQGDIEPTILPIPVHHIISIPPVHIGHQKVNILLRSQVKRVKKGDKII